LGKIEKAAIVVVAKAPRVGKVKTRLCPPLNYEQAAALYTGFLLDTIEIALQISGAEVKAVCPTVEDAAELGQLLPAEVGYVVQREAGLSIALNQAIEDCLAAGYSKVLCISSDNPTLPGEYLEMALEKLDTNDLVLGPTEDGGYYLVGSKVACPYLFEGMTWSTETVMAETLERAWHEQTQLQILPGWYDLDTGQELARFIQELPQDGTQALHTRQALNLLNTQELLNVSLGSRS